MRNRSPTSQYLVTGENTGASVILLVKRYQRNAVFRPETKQKLLAIVDRLKQKSNTEAVILGGTELPLILRDEAHNGIPFLNTTKIHVETAVTEMLS